MSVATYAFPHAPFAALPCGASCFSFSRGSSPASPFSHDASPVFQTLCAPEPYVFPEDLDRRCAPRGTPSFAMEEAPGGERSSAPATPAPATGAVPSAAAARRRRLAANARERRRMNSLNDAFDRLREVVPSLGNDRKLSKFETLQMAQTYIAALCELLHRD